ncbi:hypothetical protein GXP71_01540 [Cellulomonas sp. H30R-01]|uniref:DUF5709 domain-containing protein n=1 Tax=Cellulomonas algicola TaxID=2071633 RepID=A0A401UVT4_9CELL|nr:hypothetical protein [Cellulomonas sp. H30R-01]QHT54908.1 hypothetical protein GXP71_01540 [Cellulomonas sp. H30R-01]GCD18722.1 hypothetical protein CTKZ_02840 [Cellulomonas algicola]
MSAVPGQDAWRDAGLEPVTGDGPRRLTDDVAEADDGPEEYRPGFARADREGRADEADVVEQDTEVALDDDQDPEAG